MSSSQSSSDATHVEKEHSNDHVQKAKARWNLDMGQTFDMSSRRNQIVELVKHPPIDWHKTKLALRTSIPPTIALCCIASHTFVNYFGLSCYLIAIVAAVAFPALPRGKFILYNFRLCLAYVLAYCYGLFAGWCAVQARHNTTGPGTPLSVYNSSAEATIGVLMVPYFLFAFAMRSAFPMFNFELVVFAVYGVNIMPTLARSPNTQAVISTSNLNVEAFCTGQAIGLVSGLLIFPHTARGASKRSFKACLESLVALMQAHQTCAEEVKNGGATAVGPMKAKLQDFNTKVQKCQGDIQGAQAEFAYSHYDNVQLKSLSRLLGDLIPPLTGLNTTANMLESVETGFFPEASYSVYESTIDPKNEEESATDAAGTDEKAENSEGRQLEELVYRRIIHLEEGMCDAIQHIMIRLGYTKKKKAEIVDVESSNTAAHAGQASFLENYQRVIDKSREIDDTPDGMTVETLIREFMKARPKHRGQVSQKQYADTLRYFTLLHIHVLVTLTVKEFHKLLVFVEENHTNKPRIVLPQFESLNKWINILSSHAGPEHVTTDRAPKYHDGWKDPDHLPPANKREYIGDKIRKLSYAFRSTHIWYGLRGACAILSITIISLLRDTQNFYFQERFLWACFAVILSFNRTAGASTFSLGLRFLATFCTMAAAYVIWYMPDRHTAGILVFFWLWLWFLGLLFVMFPKYFSAFFVSLTAACVMIGNELQVRYLGADKVRSEDQAVWPPYILFPLRMADVTLGILVAYFWTIFPFPLSEHTELRMDVASLMYVLANYQASSQRAVAKNLVQHNQEEDKRGERSAPHQGPQAARYRRLANKCRTAFGVLPWEFNIGGKFPTAKYGEILSVTDRINGYITTTAYVSSIAVVEVPESNWLQNHAGKIREHLCPAGVAERLVVLHSALGAAHPLPPELKDLKIPSIRDFLANDMPPDRAFALCALIHSVNWYLMTDVNLLTRLVKDLVGELKLGEDYVWPMENGLNDRGVQSEMT